MNGLVYAGQFLLLRLLGAAFELGHQRLTICLRRLEETRERRLFPPRPQLTARPAENETESAHQLFSHYKDCRANLRVFERVSKFNRMVYWTLLAADNWYYRECFDFLKSREDNQRAMLEQLASRNRPLQRRIAEYLARARLKLPAPEELAAEVLAQSKEPKQVSFRDKRDVVCLDNLKYLTKSCKKVSVNQRLPPRQHRNQSTKVKPQHSHTEKERKIRLVRLSKPVSSFKLRGQ
jgi:hypothetical protein